MGLEDLALFRALPTATIFYPSDGVSTEKAVELSANTKVLLAALCSLQKILKDSQIGKRIFFSFFPKHMPMKVCVCGLFQGLCFIRTSRPENNIIYNCNEDFHVGQAKVSSIIFAVDLSPLYCVSTVSFLSISGRVQNQR